MHCTVVSSFPPKVCGVGQFCSDFVESLQAASNGNLQIAVEALDNIPQGYAYPPVVIGHFYYQDKPAYTALAKKINESVTDIVVLQHEYNLFGGQHNEYILDFINTLQKPLVVVMHNIPIDKTSPKYLHRTKEIPTFQAHVTMFVTTIEAGKEALIAAGVPESKIVIIGHGAPQMPPLAKAKEFKEKFDLSGQFVVMTFGLMRPKKGLEFLLQATKNAARTIPNLRTLIIGDKDHSDTTNYFGQIRALAKELQVEDHVTFLQKYLHKEQLYEYIIASDVVVTPYLKRDQVSSGPLTFAVGAGIPAISTPYLFAQELLKDIGIFVPFYDVQELTEAIIKLATDGAFYKLQQEKTFQKGKTLSWQSKGKEYYDLLQAILQKRS